MDWFDGGEFAGLAGLAWYAGLQWGWHAVVLVVALSLLVEVNLRSRGRAPVRSSGRPSRLRVAAQAARRAWRTAEDAAA